jgi:mitochondrial fission protein ELM1
MPDRPPQRVWAILGPHRGDNNQVLALAEALGLPFEQKVLRFNHWRHFQPTLLGATLKSVSADSRAQLQGKPPDLTISTGQRSVPAVRALKEKSGGKMRSVHLGYPRLSPRHFDLVVPTPEYPVPDAPNVVRIPFALSPHVTREIDPADAELIHAYPGPRRLFLIGGPTLYWELPVARMAAAAGQLIDAAARDGGSILAVGSPRTPPELLTAIRERLESSPVPFLFVPGDGPPAYPALVAAADSIFVTADSVAMVADAVTTGKPVGLIPVAKSGLGRAVMEVMDRLRPGKRLFPRDLRFFWAALKEQGFTGSIDAPRASNPPDYAALIAERVRQLLAQPGPPATGSRDSGR